MATITAASSASCNKCFRTFKNVRGVAIHKRTCVAKVAEPVEVAAVVEPVVKPVVVAAVVESVVVAAVVEPVQVAKPITSFPIEFSPGLAAEKRAQEKHEWEIKLAKRAAELAEHAAELAAELAIKADLRAEREATANRQARSERFERAERTRLEDLERADRKEAARQQLEAVERAARQQLEAVKEANKQANVEKRLALDLGRTTRDAEFQAQESIRKERLLSGQLSLMETHQVYIQTNCRPITETTAVLRVYGGSNHNFFHAQDMCLMMKPFGKDVTKAINAAATPIIVDGVEVRAIDATLVERVSIYVQSTFPDRAVVESVWTKGNARAMCFKPTLAKVGAPEDMDLVATNPTVEETVRRALARSSKAMISAVHSVATSLEIAARTIRAADVATHFRINASTGRIAGAMLRAETIVPAIVYSRVKDVVMTFDSDPDGNSARIAARGLVEAVLRFKYNDTTSTLLSLCSKVPDSDIHQKLTSIREAGNVATHTAASADWVDNMCIYTSTFAVLCWVWPNLRL